VAEDKEPTYSLALGVTFRDRKGHFDTMGSCGHPTADQESADKLVLGCGVDCDGGGLQIEMARADKSVIVRLDRLASGITTSRTTSATAPMAAPTTRSSGSTASAWKNANR
jgi:hypothetical protein